MKPPRPSPRILLVDDDEDIRRNAGLILSLEGYNVTTAGNGQEALDILKSDFALPDLIISDIAMPRMDGYALFQAVRQIPALRLIPFIFLTAHGSRRHIRYGRELGVDDYLIKPFDPVDLLNAVRNKLNRADEYRRMASQEFDGARRSLVQLLSHELRTPLTYITGGFEMLADSIGQDTTAKDMDTSVSLIRSGTHRLTRLAEQVVRYAELVSGQARIQLERLGELYNPTILADNALGMVRNEALARRINLEVSSAVPDNAVVFAASDLMVSAIYEVLRNAVSYSPEGSTVWFNLKTNEHNAFIEVIDQGRGILVEDQSLVWDIMTQSERQKHEQQGVGMGLPIVKQTLLIHSGSITLESAPGKGTRVVLALPLVDISRVDMPGSE